MEGALRGNIWVEQHGKADGKPLVLLHGLGANGAVWDPFLPFVAEDWDGPCIVPDFRGHGRSSSPGAYSFGTFCADVAQCLDGCGPVSIIGHSLGGALGALLACGWFGVEVDCLLALSVKTDWPETELAKFDEVSRKPPRYFATEADAREKFLRASGLGGVFRTGDRFVDAGIRREPEGFRFAADQRVIGSAGRQLDVILRAQQARMRMATGGEDTMAPLSGMMPYDPDAVEIPGAGHNVHAERPEDVWRLFRNFCDMR